MCWINLPEHRGWLVNCLSGNTAFQVAVLLPLGNEVALFPAFVAAPQRTMNCVFVTKVAVGFFPPNATGEVALLQHQRFWSECCRKPPAALRCSLCPWPVLAELAVPAEWIPPRHPGAAGVGMCRAGPPHQARGRSGGVGVAAAASDAENLWLFPAEQWASFRDGYSTTAVNAMKTDLPHVFQQLPTGLVCELVNDQAHKALCPEGRLTPITMNFWPTWAPCWCILGKD